jgi:hypothetical protein
MASYGVFLAACGFEYYGPKGHVGFAPRLTPENFRAPFTSAEGWGTFEQKSGEGTMQAALTLKYGKLRVRSMALNLAEEVSAGSVAVTSNGRDLAATHALADRKLTITLAADVHLSAGDALQIAIR